MVHIFVLGGEHRGLNNLLRQCPMHGFCHTGSLVCHQVSVQRNSETHRKNVI